MSKLIRVLAPLAAGVAALALSAGVASAQTYGFATMQPGTLSHTSATAVAKVLKEKGGMNVVVQPTAGESVLIPLVSRGEAEFGIANIFEVEGAKKTSPNLRLIGSLHDSGAVHAISQLHPIKQREERQSEAFRYCY